MTWARGIILDNGKPWKLESFQEAFVSDVFAGIPECWLVVPEGNGKSTLVAGLALYHIEFMPSAEVSVAAASREQAEIIYRQAEGMVFRTEGMDQRFKCLDGHRRIRYDAGHARIQVFAADDRTGDGQIPTLALVDELHRHKNLRLYRTWRGKLEKRHAQIITISTAGEPGSEFEETRELIRQQSKSIERSGSFVRAAGKELVLHEWAVPEEGDVQDLELVKSANPFSGVTLPALRRKHDSPTMTEQHWRRFVCNLPTRTVRAAIQEVEWFRAISGEVIPEGEPIWVGLDVAWKWDTTAMVPLWTRDETFRLLGPATILTPPRDGSSLDPNEVERGLIEIHRRNPIHTVVMDMHRAEQLATWIESEFGATVHDRGGTNIFAAEDYERFMEALREGWLFHSGDKGLTRHALNAIARMLPSGGARFDRPHQTRQGGDQDMRVIDALSAAAMVHAEAALELQAGDYLMALSDK